MLSKLMRNLCLSRSSLVSRLFYLGCIGLLLTIGSSPVSAQTDTPTPPGVATFPPGATATPPAPVPIANVVAYDFTFSPYECDPFLFGVWSLGLGFQSDPSVLSVNCPHALTGLTKVVIYYSSTGDYEVQIRGCDTDGNCADADPDLTFDSGVVDAPSCPTQCTLEVEIDNVEIRVLNVSAQAASEVFIWQAVDLYYEGFGSEFDVDENGCPVIEDSEQLELLDAAYFASCSRCFATPTPVYDKPISLVPTASGTYDFPIISSGTPMTKTPMGVPAPATATATTAPTNTPGGATSTPTVQSLVYDYDGTAGGAGSVVWRPGDMSPAVEQIIGELVPGGRSGNGWFDDRNEFSGGFYNSGVGIAVDFENPVTVSYISYWYKHNKALNNDVGFVLFYYDSSDTLISNPSGSSPVSPQNVWYQRIVTTPVSNVSTLVIFAAGGGVNSFSINEYWMDDVYIEVSGLDIEPTPTPTATATGVSRVEYLTPVPADCSVPQFRDDTPIAEFETKFKIVDYECFRIIPEIDILGQLVVDGTDLCITFFELPLVSVFGVKISLDWLLAVLISYLVRVLLSF